MRPVEPERIDHVEVVIDEVVDRLDVGKVIGLPKPRMIRRYHVEPRGRQQPVEVMPFSGPARGVQEQQWFALAAAEKVDPSSGQLEVLLGRSVVWHRVASLPL